MSKQFKQLIDIIKQIVIIFGLVLTFFAVLEVVRAFDILHDLHHLAGYLFLLAVAGLVFYVVFQILGIFRFKKSLVPPNIEKYSDRKKFIKRYQYFAFNVIGRFSENEELPAAVKPLLDKSRIELNEIANHENELSVWVENFEDTHFQPVISHLDRMAEKIISDNVGLVTISTALSPYKSLDLYIVLARNFRMVNKIIRVYRTSPSLRETAGIFYDIFKVVAAVNILNSMNNLWAGLGRHVPIVGSYGAAVSEGLFSGLLTSVTGHAAKDRCRTYRRISSEKLARQYRENLKNWSGDIISILRSHIWERISPFKKGETDFTLEHNDKDDSFWDKILSGIKSWKI